MSRKLKKRIRELCGLEQLSKNDRLKLCHEILNDSNFKNKLCNDMPGLTFKDIEKVMKDEIADKKPISEEDEIYNSLKEEMPEKLYPEEFKPKSKSKRSKLRYYSIEETLELINAKSIIVLDTPSKPRPDNYPTYSQEEVLALLNGTYKP